LHYTKNGQSTLCSRLQNIGIAKVDDSPIMIPGPKILKRQWRLTFTRNEPFTKIALPGSPGRDINMIKLTDAIKLDFFNVTVNTDETCAMPVFNKC
jgi:hypothetical protein